SIGGPQQGDALTHPSAMIGDERQPPLVGATAESPYLLERQPGPLQDLDQPRGVERALVVATMPRRSAPRREQPDRFPVPKHVRLDTEGSRGITDPHHPGCPHCAPFTSCR